VERSKVSIRVIEQYKQNYQELIDLLDRIFGLTGEGQRTVRERLKTSQFIVSLLHSAAAWALTQLKIGEAIKDQYWSELQRLDDAGYFKLMGEPLLVEMLEQKNGIYALLGEKVEAFFDRMSYAAGKSQRHAFPVPTGISWKTQVKLLAKALEKAGEKGGRLQVIGAGHAKPKERVEFEWEPSFEHVYERSLVSPVRFLPAGTMYVLCGVHGGKETHDFTTKSSIAYFAETGRLGLSLTEALALYTAHPDFLSGENASVILLGQGYEGKYATISYDHSSARLLLSFISPEEADKAYAARSLAPHDYHGKPSAVRYGKPSAGALITF